MKNLRRYKRKISLLVLITAVPALLACSPTFRYHGYVPSEDDLANVIVGVDSRESVEVAVGRPSSAGMLDDGGWYYIASRVRHYTYNKPKIISRDLVAVSFDPEGIVSNVEHFTLEDGRVITLSRRVTTQTVKGPGFFRQLLGNIGQLDLEQAAGG